MITKDNLVFLGAWLDVEGLGNSRYYFRTQHKTLTQSQEANEIQINIKSSKFSLVIKHKLGPVISFDDCWPMYSL